MKRLKKQFEVEFYELFSKNKNENYKIGAIIKNKNLKNNRKNYAWNNICRYFVNFMKKRKKYDIIFMWINILIDWRSIMLKYPRTMHGGELWAKIEVLENVFSPLFIYKIKIVK